MSDEAKQVLHENLSERSKKIQRTEEWNKNASLAQKANSKNPCIKAALEGWNYFNGKNHTEESKSKM